MRIYSIIVQQRYRISISIGLGVLGILLWFATRTQIVDSQVKVQAATTFTTWPQVQYDAAHSGYISDTFGPPFSQLWRVDEKSNPVAAPVSTRVQPVVAYNLVYIPSNNGTFYALNAGTGARVWTYTTGGPLVNSAAVDTTNTIVTVGSTDGKLYALNAQTGAFLWSFQTARKIRVAPVIASGSVYIADTFGNVYSLNILTGVQNWMTNVGVAVLETPAFYNGNLYVGTYATKAYALNGSSGAIIWSKQLYGQGFRDRWIVAGNNVVIFNPVPYNGSNLSQANGTDLLGAVGVTSAWSVQRQAIINDFNSNPFNQPMYVLDPATGNEIVKPPVLYAGGSTSEFMHPVVLPNGNFNLRYRFTEGRANPGCGATCNDWSQYLGEYNPTTNDVTQIDTWGTGTTFDFTKKGPMITDETIEMMRTGYIIWLESSRGTYGYNTNTNLIIPFTTYNSSTGGIFGAPPISVYPTVAGDGWWPSYPNSETDSDGNDWKRPTPVANGVFYILHDSTLIAVSATKL